MSTRPNSLHYLNRVSANSLERLLTVRAEVSPSFRFEEGLCLLNEIAPELTGHGLPLGKCEAYNRVYDQFYQSR
jgi:hypothetical protein